MRPFQQFRLWLRAGPVAERTVTAVATLLVLALAVWAAVPTGGGASDDGLAVGPGTSTTGGDTGTAGTGAAAGTATGVVPGTTGSSGVVSGAAGTTGASGASGTAGGPGGPVTSTGSSGAGTTSGTGGPTTQCPGAVAGQGVSATEIRVGVVIVTIGELNPAIGIPSEADHQRAYEAIFADYNKRGGAVCRKLVPRFYVTNPINAETERAACLQMQQDKVFAVINNLFNPQNVTCVAQAKIPNFWYTTPHTPEIRKYHPYILSFQSDYDRLIETYVRGAKTVGWFAGVQKIGILDQSCFPDLSAKIRTELRGAGYPDSQWSVFNYGCTQAISEPEKDTQAAIQFQRDQVTHVMSVEYLGSQNFARAAQQQGYRPKYAVMSDAQIQASDRSSTGPPESFDGALDMTNDQIGSENTPGYRFNPATEKCRKIIRAAGLQDPVDPMAGTAGTLYGVACTSTAMLVAALGKLTTISRTGLAPGLAQVGRMDLSFPAGPAIFSNAANPTGGQFWRTGAFEYDCNCWRVTRRDWRRGFG